MYEEDAYVRRLETISKLYTGYWSVPALEAPLHECCHLVTLGETRLPKVGTNLEGYINRCLDARSLSEQDDNEILTLATQLSVMFELGLVDRILRGSADVGLTKMVRGLRKVWAERDVAYEEQFIRENAYFSVDWAYYTADEAASRIAYHCGTKATRLCTDQAIRMIQRVDLLEGLA